MGFLDVFLVEVAGVVVAEAAREELQTLRAPFLASTPVVLATLGHHALAFLLLCLRLLLTV
jgi:hypothetical protein